MAKKSIAPNKKSSLEVVKRTHPEYIPVLRIWHQVESRVKKDFPHLSSKAARALATDMFKQFATELDAGNNLAFIEPIDNGFLIKRYDFQSKRK